MSRYIPPSSSDFDWWLPVTERLKSQTLDGFEVGEIVRWEGKRHEIQRFLLTTKGPAAEVKSFGDAGIRRALLKDLS